MARTLKDIPPDERGMPIEAWLKKYHVSRPPDWALTKEEREKLNPPSTVVSKKSTKRHGA